MFDDASKRARSGLCFASAVGALLFVAFARTPEAQDSAVSVSGLRTQLASVESEARYLRDRKEIAEISKRFTRGVDRHDKDLVRSAFWPDGSISYGVPMAVDQYVDWQEEVLRGYAAHQHHVTGQTIDVDGDTAHVESYVLSLFAPRDTSVDIVGPATPGHAATSEKTVLSSGRFVDRWERRGAEWRISVREYVEDLRLLGDTVDLCANGCLARWDKTDLSYIRPLERLTTEQRKERQDAGRQPTAPAR